MTYESEYGTITAISYDRTGITFTVTSLDGATVVRRHLPLGSGPYVRLDQHCRLPD